MNSPVFPHTTIKDLTDQDYRVIMNLYLKGHQFFLIVDDVIIPLNNGETWAQMHQRDTNIIFII